MAVADEEQGVRAFTGEGATQAQSKQAEILYLVDEHRRPSGIRRMGGDGVERGRHDVVVSVAHRAPATATRRYAE